jgi:multisubunit Na+/H+ antiporter MnhB subunit
MRDMPGASPVPHRRSSTAARTGEARRVATVAMLLAVTVVGLRTRGAFSHTPDAAAAGATGAVLATALAACEGVAFVAFIVLLVAARPQRRPRDEQEPERLLFPWWAKTAGVLLALGLLVTPFVLLLSLKVRKYTPVPPVAHLVNPVSRSQPPNAAAQSSAWPLIAGLVIAIAVVLTLTWLTRRRRLPGRPQNRVDRAVGLAEGLAAGSAALQANHEPRAAIIACYAAMEQGFAAAGSAPAAADTPAEVLARATAAGIVRSGSAEVLTGLFRRARYSDEPMTSADSAAAATALVQMRADLAGAGAGASASAEP